MQVTGCLIDVINKGVVYHIVLICRCYHSCVNGTCSGPPNYQCVCNLGWTGDDCSINCGCNFHSTCRNGVGKCDKCQDFTDGEFCQKCQFGFYGNPAKGKLNIAWFWEGMSVAKCAKWNTLPNVMNLQYCCKNLTIDDFFNRINERMLFSQEEMKPFF